MGDNLGPGLLGCIIGFIFAGIVGFISSRILWHWGRVTAIGKKQTIKLTTDKTPWQVLVEGCQSLFLLLSIFLVVVLLLATFFFGWERVIAFVRNVAQP
jgi:hypothetical protein